MSRGSNVLDRLDAFAVNGIGARGGVGAPSQRWSELVKRAANSSCTILITGETGVGKEHLARWIHGHGPQRGRAFVPVNWHISGRDHGRRGTFQEDHGPSE